jgi:hypothetical protein
MLTRIPWSLNELLKFVIFCANFVRQAKITKMQGFVFPDHVEKFATDIQIS